MSEQTDGSGLRQSAPVILAGGLLLLILYILSPLPLFRLYMRFGAEDNPLAESVYAGYVAPLVWACERSTMVEEFYDWYMDFERTP